MDTFAAELTRTMQLTTIAAPHSMNTASDAMCAVRADGAGATLFTKEAVALSHNHRSRPAGSEQLQY